MEGFFKLSEHVLLVLLVTYVVVSLPFSSSAKTQRFQFNVEWKKVTRLCHRKPVLTVNGEYPGPTIAVHEGDNVEIKVTNLVSANTTIHWHGVKQKRTGWADGPAYITQCPIRQGESYTYRFKVVDQRGTLWWHAHHSWQRASVHGAFIIHPNLPFPFSSPPIHAQFPIIFGEWWNRPVEAVEEEMMASGAGPDSSDAYTINGFPGPLYPCSDKDTLIQSVEPGKTYLLRIINAALNDELFFAIEKHTMTVVEIDSVYTKPFETKAIMIAPGQTTTILITTNQVPDSSSLFPMAARPYLTSVFPFDNSTTLGFLQYANHVKLDKSKPSTSNAPRKLVVNNLPEMKDDAFATSFLEKLRSLGSAQYPCNVPKSIYKRVVIAISLNLQDCPPNKICKGYNGKRFLASMNNQSFVRPTFSLLDYHYKNIGSLAYSSNFPDHPPNKFDFTGVDPLTENMNPELGTKLIRVPYGTNLEIVFQSTSFLNIENHPIHVHGHNFFVVGRGPGNFDVAKDPAKYNLVDPPERNTVAVPTGGWAAIRMKADNPGVWFIHCHLEVHTSWGLATAIIVGNGPGKFNSIHPPPRDLPSC